MSEKKTDGQQEAIQVIPYRYVPCPPDEEDTIDLRELWQTLKKRQKTIWWTTGLVFIAGLFYLWMAKSVYEARATIAIGKQLIKKSDGTLVEKYFDDVQRLKQLLDVKYDTAGKYREKNVIDYIKSIDVPKNVKGFLTIISYGSSNDGAIKVLRGPIDFVENKHKTYLESILDTKRHKLNSDLEQLKYYKGIELKRLYKELELARSIDLKKVKDKIALIEKTKIPTIEKKIEDIDKEIKEKKQTISQLQKSIRDTAGKDPALAAMSAMQMGSLQNDVARLLQKRLDLLASIREYRQLMIPDLEAEQKRILEKVIPAKEAAIKKLESMIIPKLQSKIDELKVSMKPPYLTPTKVIGGIKTHDHPIKPKKKLVLIVSLITGLMLGVFLALFREFLNKAPEERP